MALRRAAGTMSKDRGNFGFIQQDSGEDMFVMPAQCEAFGGALPPLGTRVQYVIVQDPKTGRPRAENVEPEGGSGDLCHGTISKVMGKWGFIAQDNGEPDMFVMPAQCQSFGATLPPIGTRVVYRAGIDRKKGQPCAEDVQPEEHFEPAAPAPSFGARVPAATPKPRMPVWGGPAHSGTMLDNNGRFGFIQQDGGDKMFVLPLQCEGFGGTFPPEGTRVVYDVVNDPKTGRPRADNVQPEDGFAAPASRAVPSRPSRIAPVMQALPSAPPPWATKQASRPSGTMMGNNGRFGFIQQDSGDKMFVMPLQCEGFGGEFPPEGTRVTYDIVNDPKTGRPRADNVQPEGGFAAPPPWAMQSSSSRGSFAMTPKPSVPALGMLKRGRGHSGTMQGNNGRFGFIEQDSGEANMFVLPLQCEGFGGEFPPEGTRVTYEIVNDPKTGRPRADNVQPEGGFAAPASRAVPSRPSRIAPIVPSAPVMQALPSTPPPWASKQGLRQSGTMMDNNGRFGFIQQDSGDKMFVMPLQCEGFGGEFPPQGTRVTYDVVNDPKTGRPRADNVQPEDGFAAAEAPEPVGGEHSGTMMDNNGRFGFIEQDSGEGKMFVMPLQCEGFGRTFPPEGTRVRYEIVTDPKTGRLRAENVQPEQVLDDFEMLRELAGGDVDAADIEQLLMEEPALGASETGTVSKSNGKFGFIKQDSGEADLFMMPGQCTGFDGHTPPAGTRVSYNVGVDRKKGQPCAENVGPEGQAGLVGDFGVEAAAAEEGAWAAGTMRKDSGRFGFIQQDDGQDMFVMPVQCQAFGGRLPAEGTRVVYQIVLDPKTGKPRAEDVQPEGRSAGGAGRAQKIVPTSRFQPYSRAGGPSFL